MRPDLPSQLAVVGLGYVGLSLATGFGRLLPTIGFDTDPKRTQEIQRGNNPSGDLPKETLNAPYLSVTNDPAALGRAEFIIIAVPTPVDSARRPDLSQLIEASRLVGQALRAHHKQPATNRPRSTIVYESTVYPGCTEEVCIPVLERESGLKAGQDFKVGYSPERINPGDPEHTLDKVVKIVAGQDRETTEAMAKVYEAVVKAGVHKAPDIRTAEAAKVIENVQRDLNIALMNELSVLFHQLGIDTREVLEAACTKWNFLPFKPGLVGGHCIPVDPYYLTHKAQEAGYYPEVILAGRRINDSMGLYIARETIKLLIRAGKPVRGAKVLVLGVAFKENVSDIRNTQVVGLVKELENHGVNVVVYDSLVDAREHQKLGLSWVTDPFEVDGVYDAVILAVPHRALREKPVKAYLGLLKDKDGTGVLVDVKGVLNPEICKTKVLYWSL